MDQVQEQTDTRYEKLVAEVAKAKADHTYQPVLPGNVVMDAEFPDGFYVMRPSIEEFVSHGYKAENYDTFFGGVFEAGKQAWGPGWSEKPEFLKVRSQVRRVGTRTQRATSSTRHRFKQYLFNDPSHRLVRNGERTVPAAKVVKHIDELIKKEADGILSVHTLDGRKVNLQALKAGIMDVAAAALPAPQPNPPLDSIANDTPSGNPMPIFIDGTFPGDATADRALGHMLADKRSEQGDAEEADPLMDEFLKSTEDDDDDKTAAPGDAAAVTEVAPTEAAEESVAPDSTEPAASQDTGSVPPAADVAAPSKGGKKGKK